MQRLTQSTSRVPLGGLLRSALKSVVVVVVASLCRPSILVCSPPLVSTWIKSRVRSACELAIPIIDRSTISVTGDLDAFGAPCQGWLGFGARKNKIGRSEAAQRCTAPSGETRGDDLRAFQQRRRNRQHLIHRISQLFGRDISGTTALES
ncbi:hypothetical protein B0T11DRAFT_278212 [Plectosphaerella cucumerina]|uniref:Uncharacterized protein n=1 Tax=Plectosphaerella cucumerina TaxID=40658 RepID=A0A8K0TMK2_9PEZI|nr:hypothetical protein B0T11DRAFT_278212 [Plectosphaerella cucumerina]